MSISQFGRNFIENEYHLSRYKNAAFSAIVVAICLLITYFTYWSFFSGALAGAFIVGAQSVSAINRQGAFRIRLSIAMKTTLILPLSALLGVIAGTYSLGVVIVVGIILAFSFGWWRQLFPVNWPDIVIPSAVLFFMSYAEPAVYQTLAGAVFGLFCELVLGIIIYCKKYLLHSQQPKPEKVLEPPVPLKNDKTVLGMKSYLLIYSIQLSLLLTIGFLLVQYTSYPHAYWMPLTCVMILKVGRHSTLRRVIERTLGTLAGCLFGSVILYQHLSPLLNMLVMIICIFVWLCFLRSNYALGTVFITTFVLLLLGTGIPFSLDIVAERIVFTVMGGILTLLSSFIFLKRERLT